MVTSTDQINNTSNPEKLGDPGHKSSSAYKDADSTHPDKDAIIDDPVYAEREGLAATIGEVAGFDPSRADSAAALMLSNARGDMRSRTSAPQADVVQAPRPGEIGVEDQYLDEASLEDATLTGIGIGNTEATTREVQDEELVANQLEGLLAEDSSYIRNARMRAMEQANARGGFGSSFAAGAAERSAMEAALPIATADAQAFRDTATQNMNALNSMALANLQRATSIDTALLSANTQRSMANLDAGIRTSIANLDAMTKIDISNLDAATRTNVANMQAATQVRVQEMADANARFMQGKQLTHETGLEQLRQQGRVELATMDSELQSRLAEYAHEGRIELQALGHEDQLEMQSVIQQYDAEQKAEDRLLQRNTERNNLAMQAEVNYLNYVTAYAQTDMDSAAARRLSEDAANRYKSQINIINNSYPELDALEAGVMGSGEGYYGNDPNSRGKKDAKPPAHGG